MRRLTPTQIALIVAGVLILAFVAWTFASTRRSNPDALSDSGTAAEKRTDPARRCASQATLDLIKRELFRRAAALRGNDRAAYDRLAAYAVVRVERPLLGDANDETGAISCSGALTLDLPPGVAVVGGRRTLSADVDYALQPAADGNGEVLTLTRADSIITPLATLSRVGGAAVDPLAPAAAPADSLSPVPIPMPPPDGSTPPAAPSIAPPPPPPTFAGRPSFNCAAARTRGEMAVCGDSGLAALDRQMAAHYVDALRDADPQTRAELQRTRDRFLAYRDQCPNSACIAEAYRGRMREISDIAGGR